MIDYIASGPPSGISAPGAAAPALYLDKSANVLYTLGAQGWQPLLESTQDGMTAHAGGGQGSATQITTQNARFTTVATIGDSSILPGSVVGLEIAVSNAGAASMNVFPPVGSQINAGGANAAFAVAAGKTAVFVCFNATQWHALLSA